MRHCHCCHPEGVWSYVSAPRR